MIGLGVATYQRPWYCRVALESIRQHLNGVVDVLDIYHDGEPPVTYGAISSEFGLPIRYESENRGVGYAKNRLLERLLDAGCDWLFLMEDDIEVTDVRAVTGYIDACESEDVQHLMFHAHGPANDAGPRWVDGAITAWPNSVGAWCIYSRESLEKCGLFDEAMFNAFEHVEHSQRLASAGYTAPWPANLDATGSEEWLREQPDSIQHSSIPMAGRLSRMNASRERWKATRPDTYRLVFLVSGR